MDQRRCAGVARSTSLTRYTVSGSMRLSGFASLSLPDRCTGSWKKIAPAALRLDWPANLALRLGQRVEPLGIESAPGKLPSSQSLLRSIDPLRFASGVWSPGRPVGVQGVPTRHAGVLEDAGASGSASGLTGDPTKTAIFAGAARCSIGALPSQPRFSRARG